MWFLTGIGMIWSRGMPRMTPEVALSRMAPLDLDAIAVGPAEAAGRAGLDPESAGNVTLKTLLGRPVYRFSGRSVTTVFADTGQRFRELKVEDAAAIAAGFAGVSPDQVTYLELLTAPDQWTMTALDRLPMYKFGIEDGSGSEVYVAAREGEVTQFTTRRGRALAWISVIPHFLYFQGLRMDNDLWVGLMTWGPGIGVVVALLGVLLGILHFRPTRPFRLSRLGSYIPYKGWLRWHYAAGLVFGVLALTFVSSGLLSMEPWEWTLRDESLAEGTRRAFGGGTGDLNDYPAIDAAAWPELSLDGAIKEVALVRVLDEPRFVVRSAPDEAARIGYPDGGHQPYFVARSTDPDHAIIAADSLRLEDPLSEEVLLDRLSRAIPDAPIVETAILDEYDSYYYSRENRSPLPVLRVKLADSDQTWLYIDRDLGQVVGRINRVNRIERWVYAALHTFDFPFLYDRRPLWISLIVIFCLGGAFVSGLGVLLGVRRIVRGAVRMTAPGNA
jgi:hypothetical protein